MTKRISKKWAKRGDKKRGYWKPPTREEFLEMVNYFKSLPLARSEVTSVEMDKDDPTIMHISVNIWPLTPVASVPITMVDFNVQPPEYVGKMNVRGMTEYSISGSTKIPKDD